MSEGVPTPTVGASGEAGKALVLLRALGGLSQEDCARGIGMEPGGVRAAEQDGDTKARARLAAFYGIDAEALADMRVVPDTDAAGATVFLLHGPYQDFSSLDLDPLARALRDARVLTALDTAASGLRTTRRAAFQPVPCAGPLPKDAAWQGYRLARRLRQDLGLGDAPLGDLRALCEEQLGIAVLCAALDTTDLRAASILDAERSAAAIVLSARDPELSTNPLLARVCIAHELCHLLFDPARFDAVQIALDDRVSADRTSKASGNALLESRAKGFAAELLIPREGVARLFGLRARESGSEVESRERVAAVRVDFKTPWEIAALHLGNLGWIPREHAQRIRHEPTTVSAVAHGMTLPEAGAGSLLVHHLLRSGPPVVADHGPVGPQGDPPTWLLASRAAARAAATRADAPSLRLALELYQSGRPRAAADVLVQRLDEHLSDGDHDAVARILRQLDTHALPPNVLTAVLMITKRVPAHLTQDRDAFFLRVTEALRARWSVAEADIARIEARLRCA